MKGETNGTFKYIKKDRQTNQMLNDLYKKYTKLLQLLTFSVQSVLC